MGELIATRHVGCGGYRSIEQDAMARMMMGNMSTFDRNCEALRLTAGCAPGNTSRGIPQKFLRGNNLMIWNAAIYWTRVVRNIAFVAPRLTLVYRM